LWASRSEKQIYLTTVTRTSPANGPAVTITELVPDLDHYNGRGGRVFPLWRDGNSTISNVKPRLIKFLTEQYGNEVLPEQVFAYIVALTANSSYTTKFKSDLATPGLRIPLTRNWDTFSKAIEIGSQVIWLHTFGERMCDEQKGRPCNPPRLPLERRPRIPKEGAIPEGSDDMPDVMTYEEGARRLHIGSGFVENVSAEVWRYEVGGKQVLTQWFNHRRKNRERPIIGDRRPPSPLGNIQPSCWLAEYTTELLNLLNVIGLLTDLEPAQAGLLDTICSGPTISTDELRDTGLFEAASPLHAKKVQKGPGLYQ
jgi:hypothetical protein